jgi:stearoyl-CoA desaturase (delta-9 desaturase)
MPSTTLEAPAGARQTPTPLDAQVAPPRTLTAAHLVTALLVGGPVIALGLAAYFGWGIPPSGWVVGMAVVLYVLTGIGVTVGFHRLFAHRSFVANRALKIALAVAGSSALQGSLIGWVAVHRHHHVFSDHEGDPHSPHGRGNGAAGVIRGFLWAHVAWLFRAAPSDTRRYAPDLLKDRDLVVVDRLFPLLCATSLAVPFGAGWLISGSPSGGFAAFVWAGLLRMALLHHVTWSINSVCHLWGRRPFATADQSRNVATLSLLSFGESWHNFHHAAPASARHGALPHQVDLSAELIRVLERAGWATRVRWPTPESIARSLVSPNATEICDSMDSPVAH